jgi:hypothetical protein
MPRYFFRVHDGDEVFDDDGDGEQHADLAAAREAALVSAREILSEAALSGKAASLNKRIEVRDETGSTIYTVSVGRAIGTEAQA